MHVTEVKARARQMRIRTSGRSKAEMIRIMQIKEGNIPCYQNMVEDCPQKNCCWRSDCFSIFYQPENNM